MAARELERHAKVHAEVNENNFVHSTDYCSMAGGRCWAGGRPAKGAPRFGDRGAGRLSVWALWVQSWTMGRRSLALKAPEASVPSSDGEGIDEKSLCFSRVPALQIDRAARQFPRCKTREAVRQVSSIAEECC